MPRAPKPTPHAVPSILLVDDVADSSELRVDELWRFEPSTSAWMAIIRALTDDEAAAQSVDELLARNKLVWKLRDASSLDARNQIRGRLQDYAYALATENHGPTRDAIAQRLAQVGSQTRKLVSTLSRVDWWTQKELNRAGYSVPDLAYAAETLERRIAELRRPRGGRRKNYALRILVSDLAVDCLSMTDRRNVDWQRFVTVVLDAARISYPRLPKNRREFEALLLPDAEAFMHRVPGSIPDAQMPPRGAAVGGRLLSATSGP